MAACRIIDELARNKIPLIPIHLPSLASWCHDTERAVQRINANAVAHVLTKLTANACCQADTQYVMHALYNNDNKPAHPQSIALHAYCLMHPHRKRCVCMLQYANYQQHSMYKASASASWATHHVPHLHLRGPYCNSAP